MEREPPLTRHLRLRLWASQRRRGILYGRGPRVHHPPLSSPVFMRVPARVLAAEARPAAHSRVAKSPVFMRVPGLSQGFLQERMCSRQRSLGVSNKHPCSSRTPLTPRRAHAERDKEGPINSVRIWLLRCRRQSLIGVAQEFVSERCFGRSPCLCSDFASLYKTHRCLVFPELGSLGRA